MTKGHNKGKTNDPYPENKVKGQDRHLTDKKKIKLRTGAVNLILTQVRVPREKPV